MIEIESFLTYFRKMQVLACVFGNNSQLLQVQLFNNWLFYIYLWVLYLSTMNKNLFKYFDFAFLLKFFVLFIFLVQFNLAYNGIVSPEGKYYSPFLDEYFNYIAWLRNSLVISSNLIIHLFGIDSVIYDPGVITVKDETTILVSYECFGLGVSSFWIAFVLANSLSLQAKLIWSITGVLAIWFINCWRLGLLFVSMQNNWQVERFVDHHDFFTYSSYILILILIHLFLKQQAPDKKQISVSA